MPIGHTPLKLSLLRGAFFLLDCIPPASLIFTAYHIYSHLQPSSHASQDFPSTKSANLSFLSFILHHLLSTVLPLYMFIEASFYVFFMLQRARLQKTRPVPMIPDHDRGKFFYRVLDEMEDDWEFRKFFAGWFCWRSNDSQLFASEFGEIYKNDIKDWISWAFFSASSYDSLARGDARGRELALEIDEMVSDIEHTRRFKFEAGFNPLIRPVRLNYNEVQAYPKPILIYTAVYLAESLGGLVLRVMGFDRFNSAEERFPGRSGLETPSITYWARIPVEDETGQTYVASKEDVPVVFFHGIGGGLFSYIPFLYQLVFTDKARPFFLVELPYVAMRLVDHVPTMEQTVCEVEDMLDAHGFTRAFFIGHSLGTVLCSWMVKNSKAAAGVALLDPIVFKTYHPSLAYNFVYRHPGRNTTGKANELLLHWLVSRELYISQFISRHFCWHQNVLWPESLPENHHIFVSRKDQIIDGDVVANYLQANNVTHSVYDIDHAEFMLNPSIERDIIQKVLGTVEAIEAKLSPQVKKKNGGGSGGRAKLRR